MHPNRLFRGQDVDRDLDLVDARSFGTLSFAHEGDVVAAHVPFVLAASRDHVVLHLSNGNRMLPLLAEPRRALLVVTAADAYVSPDWYDPDPSAHTSLGPNPSVPTWNYVAVHLRGTLETLGSEETRGVLELMSRVFEGRIEGKAPWTIDKVDAASIERMMRAITPVWLRIETMESTWKLGQNKVAEARAASAAALAGQTQGTEIERLRAWMREALD